MFITEYGVDSYCGSDIPEGPYYQALFESLLWREISLNMDIVSGAFVFEYIDEWWKCGSPSLVQQTCSSSNGGYPCGDVNPEYYGVVGLYPSPITWNGGDKVFVKDAYCYLKTAWKNYPRSVSWTSTNISGCPILPDNPVIFSSADAYVQGGTAANSNFGTNTTMIIQYDNDPNFVRESYIFFNLSYIPAPFITITLGLSVASIDNNEDFPFEVQVVSGAWGETTITYNNAPGVSGSPISAQRNISMNLIAIDVTQLVVAVLDTQTYKISFRLFKTSGSNTSLALYTHENTLGQSYAPYLEFSSPNTGSSTTVYTNTGSSTTGASNIVSFANNIESNLLLILVFLQIYLVIFL